MKLRHAAILHVPEGAPFDLFSIRSWLYPSKIERAGCRKKNRRFAFCACAGAA
jgi:hypothetical protein